MKKTHAMTLCFLSMCFGAALLALFLSGAGLDPATMYRKGVLDQARGRAHIVIVQDTIIIKPKDQ